MLTFAIGLVVGLFWAVGGCMTLIMGGWTGPFWIGLLVWPGLLAIDAVRDWRGR